MVRSTVLPQPVQTIASCVAVSLQTVAVTALSMDADGRLTVRETAQLGPSTAAALHAIASKKNHDSDTLERQRESSNEQTKRIDVWPVLLLVGNDGECNCRVCPTSTNSQDQHLDRPGSAWYGPAPQLNATPSMPRGRAGPTPLVQRRRSKILPKKLSGPIPRGAGDSGKSGLDPAPKVQTEHTR